MKAQGLPLNMIVLAIISALVLVVTIAFTVGGAGSTFGKIGKTSAQIGDELESLRAGCRTACDSSKLGLTSTSQWASSSYCVKRTNIDLNGDGAIGSGETNLGCWQAPLSMACKGQVQSAGNVFTVTETDCPTYVQGTTGGGGTGGSGGSGGTTDTSPPDVSISHEPASPKTIDSVRVIASATDFDSRVTEIRVYVDGQLASTCPLPQGSTGGACLTTATTYAAGDHVYYGTATNGDGLTGQSGQQTFTVTQQLSLATCGNRICESGETAINCRADCGVAFMP